MMETRPGTWLRRWQLAVDIVIYMGCATIVTIFFTGMGDCATAPTAAEVADCDAFGRAKFYICVAVALCYFPFWLRRKLQRKNGR